jgi:phage gpG-like protein
MRIDIDVRGATRTASHFVEMHRRLAQPKPALDDVADYWRQREQRRFTTAGDGTWQPLAESTVKRKGHARILFDTGRGMASLTRKGAPGSVARITGATLQFGTSIYYLRFAAKRRPLFNVTATDRRAIAGRVTAYLMGAFD